MTRAKFNQVDKAGRRHGRHRYWDYGYGKSKPAVDCNFDHGQRHGRYRKWDENGKLLADSTYEHGEVVSSKA